jgi:hypothetical protein
MKSSGAFRIIVSVMVVGGLAGCLSSPKPTTLEAVGPVIIRPAVEEITGKLVVYTATQPAAWNSDNEVHTSYAIHGADGGVLRAVENQSGAGRQSPTTIELPPGRYRVVARALNAGRVAVPVLIERARTTVVRLDGSGAGLTSISSASDLVRLPDGTPVGYRAPVL